MGIFNAIFGGHSRDCHVCKAEIKYPESKPLPSICPTCQTDLENPALETTLHDMQAYVFKKFLDPDHGEAFVTNKRIFFVVRNQTDDDDIVYRQATDMRAQRVSVDIPLDDIARIEDRKKLIFYTGLTIHTKSGKSIDLFITLTKDLNTLKEFITSYISK